MFDVLPPHKEYQGHWVPREVEDYHFKEEVEYALPNVVIALTDDAGNVMFAAVGHHPPVGRCPNAADGYCWCSNHPVEEDHTLEISC